MTRRSRAQSSVQNASSIPLPNERNAPRVRLGLYLGTEKDLSVGVLDLQLHQLSVFYRQVFTDSEARRLESEGERMEFGRGYGVIEGDLELMEANKIKALECWSRLRTAIHA